MDRVEDRGSLKEAGRGLYSVNSAGARLKCHLLPRGYYAKATDDYLWRFQGLEGLKLCDSFSSRRNQLIHPWLFRLRTRSRLSWLENLSQIIIIDLNSLLLRGRLLKLDFLKRPPV